MTARKRPQRGLTLLEALIAVALLAALAMFLTPAVHNALRASSTIIGKAEQREDGRIARDALMQILSNAVIMDAAEESVQLQGDAASLELISLAGGSVARRFSLEISDGRLSGEISPLIESTDDARQMTEILSSNAKAFSYFGRATDDAPLAWTARWTGPNPPLLVRFEMARTEENDAERTGFDIPVAASAPLHCQFDPVSRRCRS